jgi:hypothetical protein
MHMYRADCSVVRATGKAKAKSNATKRGVASLASFKNPGAGMDPAAITPFDTVYKDGFYAVDCVDDYMFVHGDKFGDNKFSYKLAEVSGVSIVHYGMHVAKEDREPMTHEVCFSFCRTVPDMTFFGIRNGRDCYCTPYFQSIEGDDSMCDAVCEGNPGTMCGSKTKSSVFGMHECGTMASDLADTTLRMMEVKDDLVSLEGQARDVSNGMKTTASNYQALFGQAADPAAADLMQSAKVQAGKLEEAVNAATTLQEHMTGLKSDGDNIATADFTVQTSKAAGEQLMEELEKAIVKGEAASMQLTDLLGESAPDGSSANGTAAQYYPAMYFVDKEFEHVPTTCAGTSAAAPLVGDLDTCAQACDRAIHSCVGFSHFPRNGPQEEALCFLFSRFQSVTYYTKCPGTDFLQEEDRRLSAKSAPPEVRCMAKFSKFEGTTLKPDASGKCEQCFEAANKADRCFT